MADNSPLATEREGETVYGTPKEEQGSITFGSVEDHDKPYRDKEWLFYQYVVCKKNTYEIGDVAGVRANTVRRWMERHDIPRRSNSESRRLAEHGSNRPWEDKSWLENEYHRKEKTLYDIAGEQGVTPATILKWMRRHGVERRSAGYEKRLLNAPFKDPTWLEEQYIDQRRTATDIANGQDVAYQTIVDYLDEFDIPIRDAHERNRLSALDDSGVPKSAVGPADTTDSEKVADGATESTVSVGNSSYTGPDIGVDLTWEDSSDIDREKWLPYWDEEWLRWQYNHLENSVREMADICGVVPSAVRKQMERHGIERGGSND